MKNTYSIRQFRYCTILSTILLLVFSTNASAQVEKTFTQRTSTQALQQYVKDGSDGKVYNLRGDFTMAGNTNLTLSNYSNSGSNSDDMSYVDVDLDRSTINSSSSFLNIADDDCTEIVYAGLYWSGRANTGNRTFNATANVTGYSGTASDEILTHSTSSSSNYRVGISRQTISIGNSTEYYPRYEFNFEGTIVQFDFSNSADNSAVSYRLGTSGNFISVAGTYTSGTAAGGNNRGRFTFTTPFLVTVNGREYKINYLNRDSRIGRSQDDYRSTNYGYAQVNLKVYATNTSLTRNLDKRKVWFKKQDGTYQEITAAETDIRYPSGGTNANMYAAYADVTSYVRANKGGNYFVADIATTADDDNSGTGYYGGWGLVVIYANPNMKWRDITVFDGYAYVAGSTTISHQLPITGFKAAQDGDVNVDIGVMAGEGDRSISGDYLQVLGRGGTSTNTNHYKDLGNSGSTGGFFNSNVDTGSIKNPNLVNNTGLDIQRLSLPNQVPVYTGQTGTSNYIIGNNATSTTFRYGSTQDTYIIYNLVFAVDAYIPDVEGFNQVLTTQTSADISDLQPGDEVTYTLDVFNYGSDFIDNAKIDVDVPYAMKLIDYSMVTSTQTASGATAAFTFSQPEWINPATNTGSTMQPAASEGGILRWTLGTIPTQATVANFASRVPMATLTYTLKVTDNCLLLQTSKDDCAVKPTINGTITGKGRNSGEDFSTDFIRGYDADCNNTPIPGGIDMEINPSPAFLTACSLNNPIQGETRVFRKFCQANNNLIPRSEIAAAYIAGTKFYSNLPSGPAPQEVLGGFPVNPNGTQTMYYAVLPGANQACFYQLVTQLDVITVQPTVNNVAICEGETLQLNNTASTGYTLYYFQNESDTSALATAPNPTQPGTYTYWAANGVAQGTGTATQYCYGPKKEFTITINAKPAVATITDQEVCAGTNYSSSISMVSGITNTWQYQAPNTTTWVSLTNQLPGVSIVNNQINIVGTQMVLNNTKFRVMHSNNTTNCVSYSSEMLLNVKGCSMRVNPQIYNKFKRP